MLSGHRRKAAYALLAQTNEGYATIPCRIINGVSDAEALVLLHTANFFVRQLNVLERAAASEALGQEVEKIREADPSLVGVRTEDIKAAIITAHTGNPISGKTVQRQEATARKVEAALTDEWRAEVAAGNLTDVAISRLAKMEKAEQREAYAEHMAKGFSKKEVSAVLKARSEEAGTLLREACRVLKKATGCTPASFTTNDIEVIEEMRKMLDSMEEVVRRT